MDTNTNLLKSIQTVAEQAFEKAPYDRTRSGIIIANHLDGFYTIRVDGIEYPRVGAYGKSTDLTVGSTVKVIIPCNQASQMFIAPAGGGNGRAEWGYITGTLSSQTDLQSALDAKEPKGNVTSKGSATQPIYFDANGVAQDTTYSLNLLSATSGGTDETLVTTGDKYNWNNKQDALVSGTNIKSINNNSILGSGNLSIDTSSATWGNISGTLSNQSDLQSALNGKLNKITCEYNSEIAFGSSGKLCIGKFPCYDTNITIDIDATTSFTYHGTLVIATQNIDEVGGGSIKATVYGDATNTITPNIYIKYVYGSRNVEVYFSPQSWSKNVARIRMTPMNNGAPTDIMTSIASIPSDATRQPDNALDSKQNALVSGTNIKTINNLSLLGSGNIDISGGGGNYVTLDTEQTITAKKKVIVSDGNQASALKLLSSSTTATGDTNWRGRLVCGANNLTFLMGTYNGLAGIGAHSWTDASIDKDAAWADMYLNPDGDKSVYIGKKKNGAGWTASSGILQINNGDGKVYTYGNLLVTGNSSDTPLSIRTAAVGGGCYMGFRGSTGDALGYFGVTVTGTPVFYRGGDRVIAMMDYANSGLFTATRFKTTGAQTGTSSTANARISTSGDYQYEIVYTASSKYLKHDIKNVEDFDCTALYDIPVRQFVWNDDKTQTPTLGLIADEVAENFNIGAMYRNDYRGGKDPSDWDERIMIPAMLKLIQEQHNEINSLKSRLDEVEGRL